MESKRTEDLLKFGIGLVLVVLMNILAASFFFRIDLTQDNRFTIQDATIDLLERVDDVVYFEVYLEGDIPIEFKRLKRAIRETLDEFKVFTGDKIQYKFIDPATAASDRSRNEFYQYLGEIGIQPTNAIKTEEGKKVEKLIFPGAVISYGGNQIGAMLFKGNRGSSYLERINQSVEGVEFELASSLSRLFTRVRKRVALIRGHGELDSLDVASLTNTLLEDFQVFNLDMSQRPSLKGFDAVLIFKPNRPFSEIDKYKIDQYIMSGGSALFCLNSLHVNMDSAGGEGTYGLPIDLNLQDLLFKYGVRLNNDLIMDLNSGVYPVVAGFAGDQPQIRFLPWPFHPMLNSFGDHPIVRNMDAVSARFVGSIDTVKSPGIKKTPLLFTSTYSRKIPAPVRVSFNDMRSPPSPEQFNQGPLPVAYLLEGSFSSLFKNRVLPGGIDSAQLIPDGIPAKILITSDGDLVRNEISVETGLPLQLGFEQFSQETFANEDFVKNAMSYLVDEKGLFLPGQRISRSVRWIKSRLRENIPDGRS